MTPNRRFIYALKLQDDHYFFGRGTSKSVNRLIKKHTDGSGGWFTSEHGVVASAIVESYPDDVPWNIIDLRVNKYVLAVVSKYGTDNVRGGGYTQHNPHWPPLLS